MTDYISRADAVPQLKQTDTLIIADALRYLAQDTERHELDRTRAEELREQILRYGASMCSSADAVDCTDFIEWLVDRVLDETIWEDNSVAYGEIICRKLEKLGVLEVTEEPSYYIRPSADAVQGEWLIHGEPPMYVIECSQCGQKYFNHALQEKANFCSNCGARMKGGAE